MGFSALAPAGAPPSLVARLHPTVLFNIADSYIRRSEGQDRVIGTLLGSVGPDGVEIKNSYSVPHNESQGQVALDIDFHKTMCDLHHRVNPKEVIVGWYSTGSGIQSTDTLIHDFYGRECATPVHLTVDTSFANPSEVLGAFVGAPVTLSSVTDGPLATQFQKVALETRFAEAERVGLEILQSTNTDKLPSELDGLESSISRLESMLDTVYNFVDEVVEGRRVGDKTTGRYLADTVNSVPKLTRDNFEKLFNDSIQDVLLVMYLSNMTRTQLALSERLNTNALAS